MQIMRELNNLSGEKRERVGGEELKPTGRIYHGQRGKINVDNYTSSLQDCKLTVPELRDEIQALKDEKCYLQVCVTSSSYESPN